MNSQLKIYVGKISLLPYNIVGLRWLSVVSQKSRISVRNFSRQK